jgi:putative transposase
MAKSVLDTGWSMLKTQLLYKSQAAGRWVAIVDERNTTRVCSSCEALTGPRGLDKLGVRSWECRECGVIHDRDVNAARNILKVGVRSRAYPGSPPSVSGNESRRSKVPAEPDIVSMRGTDSDEDRSGLSTGHPSHRKR